jgi:hypothetical protein
MENTTNSLTGLPINDEQLSNISSLAKLQLNLEAKKETLEQQLSELTEKLLNVSQVMLPEAMLEVGMTAFKLSTGESITVSKFYSAKIPQPLESEAFDWLRKNGHESIIKREVKCLFGKGEDAVAGMVIEQLKTIGVLPIDKTSVHPQTLKSFVKEQMESGEPFPTDLFGAYVGNKTKVAPAKA